MTIEYPAVGLGVFDGYHLGHKSLIDKCSVVVTFDPHPDLVLGKNKEIKQLTTTKELRHYVKNLRVFEFTTAVSKLSPTRFLDEIIRMELAPKTIVVGYDFRFGYKRQGDIKTLNEWGLAHNIAIVEVSELTEKNLPVKSSLVRKALAAGELMEALRMLGHDYLVTGSVIKGEGRGRKLGFPTANLKVPPSKLIPKEGVYRGRVDLAKGVFPCLIYVGSKPTFGVNANNIEVFIPEFDDDLYGEELKVFFEGKVRSEKKFENEQALIDQINQDLATCR
ncbi:MAG: riboflavin kinase/FMN adenylyltransferase [Candidatus Marinamargulisbacteria bacterium]|jgi:riboflavin kinase/FMN adenylyltransferase